jgi:uncharacterized protein (DUF302 family)
MAIRQVNFERFSVVSARSFEDVLARLDEGIGRPDMKKFREGMASATSFDEYQRIVHGVVGKADLMEFLRLDLGGPMRKDPKAKAYKIVRIIAGNPLIMKQMVEYVPDAGSYAPVTILVYESKDGVHLCYDTMASLIAGSKDERALGVARSLDEKVIRLLNSAAA